MKAFPVLWLLAVTAGVILVRQPEAGAAIVGDIPSSIEHLMTAVPQSEVGLGTPTDADVLAGFYQQRQYKPVWIDDRGLNGRGQSLLQAFRSATDDGLDPSEYLPPETSAVNLAASNSAPTLRVPATAAAPSLPLSPRSAGDGALAGSGATADRLASMDVALNLALLRYASDVRRGRTVQSGNEDGRVALKVMDPLGVLTKAAESNDPKAFVASLAPIDPIYIGLRRLLARYRAIAAAGGWPTVPEGPKLEPGMTDRRTAALRLRLQLTDDLPVTEQGRALDRFDDAVEQAVRRFQGRNGLAADGVVGPRTLAALNVPAQDRIRQILVNLERSRWLPDDLGNPYVMVNLAAFELEVVESGRTALQMRVVVGELDKRTPVFSDAISYIEFNPYWNIPRSIAVKEELPQLRGNPGALSAKNIKILSSDGEVVDPYMVDWSTVNSNHFPYRLRQEPGQRNALGRIKFMFPNPYDIYLHDTPSRSLFQRSVRAFSHGCIRVEKPLELAELLLRQTDGWQRSRIDGVIKDGRNRAVSLAKPVPVHIVYLTAWMSPDGRAQFRDDLYNRDATLVAALDAHRE
ncbi:MAG: L,D-transpeptidase family protein [Rhodospirillales bacterium]|nr:L,D-transpeptidase family protein [Rhodospirillales bacterium]